MKIRLECVAAAKNPGPPGQPPTYNFTLVAIADDPINRESFGGSPVATINVGGAKTLPHGLGQSVTIDLAGVSPDAQPVPAAARRTFGRTEEVK